MALGEGSGRESREKPWKMRGNEGIRACDQAAVCIFGSESMVLYLPKALHALRLAVPGKPRGHIHKHHLGSGQQAPVRLKGGQMPLPDVLQGHISSARKPVQVTGIGAVGRDAP